jgi:FMN phosphatase YigB (HAD superfamily)
MAQRSIQRASGKRSKASAAHKLVFLFDVDNTLLNNDQVLTDLRSYLKREVGTTRSNRYWKIFEGLRSQLQYADYLGALQQFRSKFPHEVHVLSIGRHLIEYPFANRLYPNSLDAIAHVRRWGIPVILSDGDVVFQPRKVDRSGLAEAVNGRVLIYVHKQEQLRDVQKRYPADHYVLIDDKLRILTEVKKIWGRRVTTVFVRQGHYALDPEIVGSCPPADVTIERIGDLQNYGQEAFTGIAAKKARRR